jgi:uncharacterized protein
MEIRFLNGRPALVISDREHGKTLVVADLHLGLEHELYKNGVVIAPQAKRFHDDLAKMIKETGAKRLVIVGDLKHKIPGISFREIREIPKLMFPIAEKAQVVLTRGNHDTELGDLAPDSVKVYDSKGFTIGPYAFFHGHAWPGKEAFKCDYLFTAHIHPTVEFLDDFGFRMVEKVWVKGQLDKKFIGKKFKLKPDEMGEMNTIILPTFNPLIGGFPLNKKGVGLMHRKSEYMGPLLKSGALDMTKCEAFMLDGTSLGTVERIR